MSAVYPIVLLFATAIVWSLMAWQNTRLVSLFWLRLPQIAQRELPTVVGRHPENFFFFFRRRAVEILRGDALLWRQRRRFLFLVTLSVLVPLLGFFPLFIYAVIMSQR